MNAGRSPGRLSGGGAAAVGPPPAALDPVLEPARTRFRGLILHRVLAFESLRTQAARGDHPVRALTAISDLAHKISGVGATLGFAQIGTLAAAVEHSIAHGRAARCDPMRLHAETDPLLEALLIEMEALLDE